MIERSSCGSGGCVTCPFSYNDEADQAQNYGCLPTRYDIIEMKEKSGHNWACHYDETVLCGGFARHLMENRPDLNVKEGGLISYDDWANEGEMTAIVNAFNRQIEQLRGELIQLKGEV